MMKEKGAPRGEDDFGARGVGSDLKIICKVSVSRIEKEREGDREKEIIYFAQVKERSYFW